MHWRAMRARPPATPRNLGRLPVSRRWETDGEPATWSPLRAVCSRRPVPTDSGDSTVSAEKGYLRETGNLLFHTALVVLLVALAAGKLYGFRGNVLVVEGGGFVNAASAYDNFDPGTRFSDGQLTPFSVRLDDLAVRYQESDGAPLEFRADVGWRSEPEAPLRPASISPNHPLVIDGTKVFLLGNGYAPRITVRDAKGQVTFAGAVPFLPRDGDRGMTSTGVVKVANTVGSDQLGLAATFLPTAVATPLLGPVSVFPDARVPRLYVTALWRGELGEQANVFRLETDRMTRVAVGDKPYTVELRPGVTTVLPEGLGTVTFDGVSRFASFQVAHDPGRWWALGGALLAIAGLLASLFVRRRRVFVR
jgi:cytochrome c biogenesis protein